MKAQKPAEGILKHNDFGDSKSYTVACDCGNSEHNHNVWIEADICNVSVAIYTKVESKWWSLNRWKKIWTLITRGYVEYEAAIYMSKQQALNYAKTLESAIKDVEEFRKQKQTRQHTNLNPNNNG